MFDKIIVHTSFIGETGYANHSRNFFTALNKLIPVKVRNFTVGKTWRGLNNGEPHNDERYLTDEHKEMLYKQTCIDNGQRTDHYIYGGSEDDEKGNNLHIVLNEVNHYYFYDEYDGSKIAYNVWESTLYPDDFFNKLLEFDQLWVPTQWQKDCSVNQGYSENKIRVVPEAVDGKIFFPEEVELLDEYKDERFKFLLFGRWDYRKSTTEIIKSFLQTFNKDELVDLVVSIDNPFSVDGIETTEDRLKKYGFDDERIKIKHFPSREDYVKYLKTGHVFLSCARSEGWNLPLCVPEGKKVICNDDIMNIEDVKENDIVPTHKSCRHRVIKTMKRHYKGDLYKIRLFNDFEEISVTPDHPVYAIKRERFITKKNKFKNIQNLEPEWVDAKDIGKGDLIIKSFIDENKDYNNKIIDLISIDEKLLFNNKKVWYKSGYNSNGELKKYNRFISLDDLPFILGWYIAEGCDGKSKCMLTLNISEEDIAKEWLKQIKRVFGVDGSYTKYKTTIQLRVSSTLIAKFFSQLCGENAHCKRIPKEFLYGEEKNLKILIDEYSKGDGHNNGRSVSCSTVSYCLSRQLVIGNQRIGRKSSIHKNARSEYIVSWCLNNVNYRHSNKSWWHKGRDIAQLVKNVSIEEYDGYVYNFEVENDNSYILLSGTVHNCEAMACGTPSIYSNWGAQLEFADGLGSPVNIIGEKLASGGDEKSYDEMVPNMKGNYCEPDFGDLSKAMRDSYEKYKGHKIKAVKDSIIMREEFTWEKMAENASKEIEDLVLKTKDNKITIITGSDEKYKPVSEICVDQLSSECKNADTYFYGFGFEPNIRKENVNSKKIEIEKVGTKANLDENTFHFAKISACLDAINTIDSDYFIWIDSDAYVIEDIDRIAKYCDLVDDYPLCSIYFDNFIHQWMLIDGERVETDYGVEISSEYGIERNTDFIIAANLFIFNSRCKPFFEEVLKIGKEVRSISNKKVYVDTNAFAEERIFNLLFWKYGHKKHLPVTWISKTWNSNKSYFFDFDLNHDGFIKKIYDEDYNIFFIYDNSIRTVGREDMKVERDKIILFHSNSSLKNSTKVKELLNFKDGNNEVDCKRVSTDDIINKAFQLGMGQNIKEITGFVNFLKDKNIKNVLEIGTDKGGSFYLWNKITDKNGKKISVDFPKHEFCSQNYSVRDRNIVLNSLSNNVFLIEGDSHQEETLTKVKDILKDEKVDLLFIDGDHRYEGVKQDYNMYKHLVKNGGYIAFHDINGINSVVDISGFVYKFWEELEGEKIEFNEHFIDCGIGVIKNTYNDINKENSIFVIGAWIDSKEKEDLLRQCIKDIKEFYDLPILLVSHCLIDNDIVEEVDYFIFDKENPLLYREDYSKYNLDHIIWFGNKSFTVHKERPYRHDYAVIASMQNACNFASYLKKENIIYLEYDSIIENISFKDNFISPLKDYKACVIEDWDDKTDHMYVNMFSIKTKIFNDIVSKLGSKEDYFNNKFLREAHELSPEKLILKLIREEDKNIFYSKYDRKNVDKMCLLNEAKIKKGSFEGYIIFCYKDEDLYVSIINTKEQGWSNLNISLFNEVIDMSLFGFLDLRYLRIGNKNDLFKNDTISIESESVDVVNFTMERALKEAEGCWIVLNDADEKKFLINFDSKSLGDNIAWMPYVEEFRKKNNCKVVLSTFWNDLFKEEYPEIEFIGRGEVVHNIQGQHNIGWYAPWDPNKNPNDFRTIPLQQTASDILGLDYKEIKPKITIPDKPRIIEEKYVCIGMHSTCQSKYWNYPDGWQKIIDYLNENGYKVVHISKEQGEYMGNSPPNNIIDKTGDFPIEDRLVDLKHADMFIGIGSGLSWLSWAVGTPTILISGFSAPFCEPTEGIERIHNSNVCNSCFNDPNITFDPGDWNWCPRNKDFECSKTITPEMVIDAIDDVSEKG